MSIIFKWLGCLTILKWIENRSKWKEQLYQQEEREENKKYVRMEYGLNEWLVHWKKILKWYKFLKISQQMFCLLSLITLPIGFLLSSWAFGAFGLGAFVNYAIYYIYWSHSKKLLKHPSRGKDNLYLEACKSSVKYALFFNFFPFLVLLGYRPSFDHLDYSLSSVIDAEELFRMNPNLFAEKLIKHKAKPRELGSYLVDIEEFQKPSDLF